MTPKVQHRAAITDEKQLGALLMAIDAYDGWPTLRCALQFTALTFARPGEVRGATWAEIDAEEAVWRIDGARTKVRRPHDVPLSRQALDVLREVKEVAGARVPLYPLQCPPPVPDVIEAALGHQDQNEIRRAYNRASYRQERIELMQAWSDCIDKLKRTP